jgi:hypothetical protein
MRQSRMANVYDATIKRVGHVEPTGYVYSVQGTLMGVVATDGQVSTWNAQVVGHADSSGRCADTTGRVVGVVQPHTGGVFDQGGHYRGYVAEGEVSIQLMAGAALLLLFGPPMTARAV